MVLLELYFCFLRIGFTSFGGFSMVPLIRSEVMSRGWMTAAEVADLVAIAEMTPGPFGLNCATFAGIRAAGLPGAVCANLGVLTPSLTLCALAAVAFVRFQDSRLLKEMMVGVRPACIGMILAVVLSLAETSYGGGGLLLPLIGAVDLVLLVRYRWSVPKVLALSAAVSVVFL
ncbi:MAG: chromate transporter [Clostridia bacterium]|nr:chromate transporter [Clostridia bacterium]